MSICFIAYELFPSWAYGAVGGGVLLIILVAIVVSICCTRKSKKKTGKTVKTGFQHKCYLL